MTKQLTTVPAPEPDEGKRMSDAELNQLMWRYGKSEVETRISSDGNVRKVVSRLPFEGEVHFSFQVPEEMVRQATENGIEARQLLHDTATAVLYAAIKQLREFG